MDGQGYGKAIVGFVKYSIIIGICAGIAIGGTIVILILWLCGFFS